MTPLSILLLRRSWRPQAHPTLHFTTLMKISRPDRSRSGQRRFITFYRGMRRRKNLQRVSPENPLTVPVIPTKVGIQTFACVLDSRLRGNDIFMLLCEPVAHDGSPVICLHRYFPVFELKDILCNR